MQEFLDKLQNLSGDMIFYGGSVLAVLIGLGMVVKLLKKLLKQQKLSDRFREDNLGVDIQQLTPPPFPQQGPVLEFYNWPVQVVLVVFAPAGTGAIVPSMDRWNDAFDSIVPGLAKVIATHRPAIRTWPTQFSTAGFASKFFQNVPLPGDGGKGSMYSSAGGIFELDGRPFLVGMVFKTKEPDRHGQYTISNSSEWLGVLRVREG